MNGLVVAVQYWLIFDRRSFGQRLISLMDNRFTLSMDKDHAKSVIRCAPILTSTATCYCNYT